MNVCNQSLLSAEENRAPFLTGFTWVKLADTIRVIVGYTDRRRPLKLAEERHCVECWISSMSPLPQLPRGAAKAARQLQRAVSQVEIMRKLLGDSRRDPDVRIASTQM